MFEATSTSAPEKTWLEAGLEFNNFPKGRLKRVQEKKTKSQRVKEVVDEPRLHPQLS